MIRFFRSLSAAAAVAVVNQPPRIEIRRFQNEKNFDCLTCMPIKIICALNRTLLVEVKIDVNAPRAIIESDQGETIEGRENDFFSARY